MTTLPRTYFNLLYAHVVTLTDVLINGYLVRLFVCNVYTCVHRTRILLTPYYTTRVN